MDKFDVFLKNLDELLATQPPKVIDWQVGYWAAIDAVRNAAHVAAKSAPKGGINHAD